MDTRACFTLFPALPTELRWKIWGHALTSHYIVDFIPKLTAQEVFIDGVEPPSMGPILSMDNSRISQACKESWLVIQEPYRKLELTACTMHALYRYTDFIDFSRSTFYLNHGKSSLNCVSALAPAPISIYVKSLAVAWYTYRDIIEVLKQITMFQALQQLVILIPEKLEVGVPPDFRATMTVLDLYLGGKKSCQVKNPLGAGSQIRLLLHEFMEGQCPQLGPKWPTIEVVLVPDPL
ncbi:hypothetical protein V501_07114 [Pseudogymnoascus sp. VKM F-4519 (FW-2642)]|nr:hypothetical protein V501_07114 [Pseudogymnoascus sp. VKM F-4519 (FW-2642)]